MKKNFKKLLRVEIYAPLLLFIACTFPSCFIFKMLITEPAETFHYGKTPMYFVLAIVGFLAIVFFALAIYNFKKIDFNKKRYIEEEEKLILQNGKQVSKGFKRMFFLSLAILSFISGGFIIVMGFKLDREETPIVWFIFLGALTIFVGIVMFINIFDIED